jgi:ATP-binding cassette subfamily B (MDR/TAP) protein 1
MNDWVMWIGILALILAVLVTLRGIFFGFVAENITENMRHDLYQNVFRKHIGWHDARSNNSGIITSVLSGECTQLAGLSGEAVGVMIESLFSVVFAIIVAFYFSWPMALIALCLSPLMAIGAFLQANSDKGVDRSDDQKDESDLLAADAIANFKIVASFGCEDQIIKKYSDFNEKPY